MKVFLIGATGGIEHRLVPMLHANSHEIIGLHRKPEQAEAIAQAGATPVLGGIIDMDADDLASVALDWVILRPGTLLHEDGTGNVTLGPAIPLEMSRAAMSPESWWHLSSARRSDVRFWN